MVISFKNPYHIITFLLPMTGIIYSCTTVRQIENMEDGEYRITKTRIIINDKKGDTLQLYKGQKIYVKDSINTLTIYTALQNMQGLKYDILINKQALYLHKKTFDIDLFTVPFKIRPSQKGIPVQMNAHFNVSLYSGYRVDYYKIEGKNPYRLSDRRLVIKNGFGTGIFVGLGFASINPWVTQGQVNSEYDGVVVSYGISTIYAVKKLNAGLAIGFDYLTDRNNDVWIYHNKPWIGVLLGLNLN